MFPTLISATPPNRLAGTIERPPAVLGLPFSKIDPWKIGETWRSTRTIEDGKFSDLLGLKSAFLIERKRRFKDIVTGTIRRFIRVAGFAPSLTINKPFVLARKITSKFFLFFWGLPIIMFQAVGYYLAYVQPHFHYESKTVRNMALVFIRLVPFSRACSAYPSHRSGVILANVWTVA